MKTDGDSLACNVVLLPTADVAERAIALSKQLQPHGVRFTLQRDTFVPHISLYMVQLKTGDLDKAVELLRDVASHMPRQRLQAAHYFQADGYFDVEYTRREALAQAQMAVVHAINPIRDGLRYPDIVRMQTSTGMVRENIQTYGYQSIGELFRPHLTFTRFTRDGPIETAALPPPETFDGACARLGLFELGRNGTCAREIATFDLA